MRTQVTVVTGDGEHGAPGHGPFDAIIATGGAWDIPPSWTAQLADDGTLVVPLRMNGVARSVAFRKDGSHLASTSAEPHHAALRGRSARRAALPDGILAGVPAAAWSGLTIGDMVPWCDVYLWLAGFEPGFCRLDQSGDPRLAGGGRS
jgi:protein-L-isoaspartate(D-aspartate) O-methyltransferase